MIEDCMQRLTEFPLVYLATPYSKYPQGVDASFIEACRLTARLIERGIKVYSPIAHCHPVALHGGLSLTDHGIWLPFDRAIMDVSPTILVAKMVAWQISYGIGEELKIFRSAGKPEFYIDPVSLAVSDAP
jgi:hypothetical protein